MTQVNSSPDTAIYHSGDSIVCQWCHAPSHHIEQHLIQGRCKAVPDDVKSNEAAAQFTLYKKSFPEAPLMSAIAAERLREAREARQAKMAAESAPAVLSYAIPEYKTEQVAAHELFKLPQKQLCRSNGDPLLVDVNITTPYAEMIPQAKDGYVFGDPELVKDILIMMATGIPGYLWGHAGTGKSSIVAQICALLNRPMIRSQHTASTEESHIVGQMLAKEGSTYFEPGLLTLAMRLGWVYLADEYDFAYPQVLGIYQPVLEGERLVLKEATPEWRVVSPHKQFSFIGTGNTNGSGDETGLYQGTNIQNAANFSRFGIVCQVGYMPARQEQDMLVNMGVPDDVALNLIKFATDIRASYASAKISQPIGPRELCLAAKVGGMRSDIKMGLDKAFINKLPSVSAQVARDLAQRHFG